MASGVGGLGSLDLLDLLFDHQDGILRGVELGTSLGAWHEDRVSPAVLRGSHCHLTLGLAGQPCPHALPVSWEHPAAPMGTPGCRAPHDNKHPCRVPRTARTSSAPSWAPGTPCQTRPVAPQPPVTVGSLRTPPLTSSTAPQGAVMVVPARSCTRTPTPARLCPSQGGLGSSNPRSPSTWVSHRGETGLGALRGHWRVTGNIGEMTRDRGSGVSWV